MAHDVGVPYLDEVLPGGTRLDRTWTAQTDADGVITVSGPCPTCGGPASGPPPPDLPGVADLLLLDRPADEPNPEVRRVRAECRCESDHGKEEATSCGRSWYVLVEGGRDE